MHCLVIPTKGRNLLSFTHIQTFLRKSIVMLSEDLASRSAKQHRSRRSLSVPAKLSTLKGGIDLAVAIGSPNSTFDYPAVLYARSRTRRRIQLGDARSYLIR